MLTASTRAMPGARRLRAFFALVASAVAGVIATAARQAAGQSIIQRPGERHSYTVEIEPHLLASPFNPPGDGTGGGFGAGVRANVEILHVGFVPSINDSIALGVGAGFLRYQGSGIVPGVCTRYASGPAGTNVCVDVSRTGGASNYAFLPVTMQWNFWLTRQWSMFGEPGITLYWFDYRAIGAYPVFYVGCRFHMSDWLTLTMRIGYPTFSIGVSFLL